MAKESLEEGLLLPKSITVNNNGGIGSEISDQEDESSAAATPIVVFSTFIAICSTFGSGCCLGYSSPAESGIMRDLGLSVAAYSVFGSIITVGSVLGSFVNGKTADLIGRKGTMWLSELFCIVGWFAIAFSKDAWSLDLGRFLLGIGSALIAYVVPVYIAEIAPKNIRGGFTAVNQLALSCGFSMMFFIGTLVSWRTLALIGVVPYILQVVGLFFIPESPRWLALIGREKELETSLKYLRGKGTDISREAAEIRNYTQIFQTNSDDGIFQLFQRRYTYLLIVGIGLMLLQQLGGANAVASYAGSVFEEAGFSSKIGSISIGVVQIPAVMLSVLLIDKSGRRPLLIVSSIGMCLFCLAIGLGFYLQDLHYWKDATPLLVFIGVLGYGIAFSIGVAGLPWVIISEIFPINVKGSAGSLASLVSGCSSWFVIYTFNFMMQWSPAGTFFGFSTMCAASIVFVVFLVPETKGRTLEELQASMTHL